MTTSTSVERRRLSARLALLSFTTALCSGLAVPAAAQLAAPAPVRQSVDANGVDLFAGTLNVNAPGISAGQGDQGLSYHQLNRGSGWTDSVTAALNQNGSNVTVSLGGTTDQFTASGTTYTATQGNGATLTFNSGTSVYTYTRSDGTVVHFSPNRSSPAPYYAGLGRVTDIAQPSGTKLLFTYDSISYCTRTKELADGPVCTAHATAYRVASVRNSYGYGLTFNHDALDPSYDPNDPYSQLDVPTWSTVSGVTATNLASGGTTLASESFGYTPGAPNFTVTDPLGRTTSYRMSGNVVAGVTRPGSSGEDLTATYSNGRVTSVAMPAGTWTYAALDDANGQRTVTVTDPSSASTAYVFDIASSLMRKITDAQGHVTVWDYDASGRVTLATAPEGGSIGYGYDARGNVISAVRHAKPGSGQADIASSAAYPSACGNALTCNQPTSTTDANGNITNYTYDPTHGGVLTVTAPAPTPGTTPPQVRYGYTALTDYLGGTVYRQTSSSACRTQASCAGSADEVVASTTYGSVAANNLLPVSTSTGAGDGSLTATTSFAYDAAGNVTSIDGPLPGADDTTRYVYDAYRRPVETVSADPDGPGPLKNRAAVTNYTSHDQVASTQVGTANPDGSGFVSLQEANAIYDAADRKVRDTVTAGGTTYAVTQYSYDPVNRTMCAVLRMNPANWTSSGDACTAKAAGADGPDRISKVQYDQVGRTTLTISAYGTADQANDARVTYTNDGQMATATDANGNVTAYEYDGFDRLFRTRYANPSGGGSSPNDYEQFHYDANGNLTFRYRRKTGDGLTYSYDALNRLTRRDQPADGQYAAFSYDNLGRLVNATDVNNAYTAFTYDALGRRTSQSAAHGGTLSMNYDLAGRRTRLSWPDGFYVTYDYDNLDEMTAIHENGGTVLASFSYDDQGRRKGLARGNGTSTSYGYDAASRLGSLNLNGGPANAIGFGYNPAGQITSRTASNDQFAWTGASNVSRSYAVNGLNQYTQAGPVAPTYDAQGNITSLGSGSYSYSMTNRMFNFPGGYIYSNALGQWLDVSTEQRWMVYDGDQAVEEYGYDGAIKRRYVFGPAGDEPLVWYEGSGTSDRRWLHADERGSIVAVTNDAGSSLAINTYDEYGNPGASNQGRFGYTGQAWIPAIGMWYYKARMYNSSLGGFMQTDPIGYGDGLNWYNYVGGDPVNFTDPMGLVAAIPSVLGGGGGGDVVVNGLRFGWTIASPTTFGVPGRVTSPGLGIDQGDESDEVVVHGVRTPKKSGPVGRLTPSVAILPQSVVADVANEVVVTARRVQKTLTQVANRVEGALDVPFIVLQNLAISPACAASGDAACTLAEQLAIEGARGSYGAKRIMQGQINDPRYPENVWGKFQYIHPQLWGGRITVHFWRNLQTGAEEGFKIKR